MSDRPLVSIVLPTYNRAGRLPAAVASCLAQSYREIELIIVDDASPDNTPDVVSGLAGGDARIRPVRHDRNRKLPAALNTGFAMSRGRYLTWTSDDNAFRPDAIARMVATLEAEPSVGMVYADYTVIDDAGLPRRPIRAGDPLDIGTRNVIGACFLYRREVYEAIGGYAEDLFLGEDYDYFLRIAARFPMRPLHEDLYLYREHGQSLTEMYTPGQDAAVGRALERNIDSIPWRDRRSRAVAHLRLARHASERGDMAGVRRSLWAAAVSSPGQFLAGTPKGLLVKSLVGTKIYNPVRRLLRTIAGRPA